MKHKREFNNKHAILTIKILPKNITHNQLIVDKTRIAT